VQREVAAICREFDLHSVLEDRAIFRQPHGGRRAPRPDLTISDPQHARTWVVDVTRCRRAGLPG